MSFTLGHRNDYVAQREEKSLLKPEISGLNLLMDNICLKNVYCVHWIAKNNEKDDNA